MGSNASSEPVPEKTPAKVDASLKNIKCPYCGGTMLQGRKSMLQRMHMYWQKPWGPVLKMDEAVLPLACVRCGGVVLALREGARVAREWEKLTEEEKKAALEEE